MDPEVKKKVLRQITYGLYIMSARVGDEAAAAGVTWVSQASFSPSLVMVAVRADSHLHALIERGGAFAVSVVTAEKKDLAADFFRASKVENGRINGHAFEDGPSTGAPLLLELPAWFEARVVDTLKRGDHTVYLAEVIDAGLRGEPGKPVVLSDTPWTYGG